MLPGLLLVVLFMGYVVIWSLLHAEAIPAGEKSLPLAERLRRSRRLIPVILLIAGVIGSIYSGIASPTDAAAVAVAALPFFLLLVVALILIVVFPSLVTLLPNMMGG